MGLHHRDLTHTDCTGDHLKGGPSHVGMMKPSGKAPFYVLAFIGFALVVVMLLVR